GRLVGQHADDRADVLPVGAAHRGALGQHRVGDRCAAVVRHADFLPSCAMDFTRWLHLLAMAFFVGGQLVLVAAVVPALRSRDREGLRAVARRFGWGSLAALVVLAGSGAAMAGKYSRW